MGQKATKEVEKPDEVVYESIPLTDDDKYLAQKGPDKPLPGYAYLRDRRPKMYSLVEKTYEFIKKDVRQPPQRGNQMPVYELATMPGCFYHGEWKNGRPYGMGKIYGVNGIYFEGGLINGVATCKYGIFIYPDGSYYKGMFKDNKFHGPGSFHYAYNYYHYGGEWKDNKPHGKKSVESFKNQQGLEEKYQGQFVEGKKHGQGKYTFADGKIYKGQFSYGHIHGHGIMMVKGFKSTFEGLYEDGKRTAFKPDPKLEDTQFYKNKNIKQYGKLVTQYGTYEGKFLNGLMHDKSGKFTYFDNKVYVGPFEFGQMHGEGTISCAGGHSIKGKWVRGRNVAILGMKSF